MHSMRETRGTEVMRQWRILREVVHGNMRPTVLSRLLGVTPKTITRDLKALSSLGFITRSGYGVSMLTDEGADDMIAIQRMTTPEFAEYGRGHCICGHAFPTKNGHIDLKGFRKHKNECEVL